MALQSRRSRAHALQTTFVYDFIDVLGQAVRASWRKVAASKIPSEVIKSAVELVFDEQEKMREVKRAPGMNTIGMVAWLVEVATPEYPTGRKLVVIGNDVTIQAGSFGPIEDRFFAAASKLARELGVPRLYVSANSGARIGLATEALDLFKVKFVGDDPAKGFEYIYLDDESLHLLQAKAPNSVMTSLFRPRMAATTTSSQTSSASLRRASVSSASRAVVSSLVRLAAPRTRSLPPPSSRDEVSVSVPTLLVSASVSSRLRARH